MGRVIRSRDLPRRPRRLAEGPGSLVEEPGPDDLAAAMASRDLEVVRLAASMARRLVGDTVTADPAALERIFGETVERAGGLQPAVLRINPLDMGMCNLDDLPWRGGIEVVGDEEVGRFGCVLEAGGVRIERGLEPMVRGLLEMVGRWER